MELMQGSDAGSKIGHEAVILDEQSQQTQDNLSLPCLYYSAQHCGRISSLRFVTQTFFPVHLWFQLYLGTLAGVHNFSKQCYFLVCTESQYDRFDLQIFLRVKKCWQSF